MMSNGTDQKQELLPPGYALDLAAGESLRRVQGQYTTAMAVQRPRDLRRVEESALREAALIGEDGFYAWGAGKNHVEGPSKHLALCLARCWGNSTIEMMPVQETKTAWIFTATFIDLEAGFTLARQVWQSKKWEIHGNFDPERAMAMRFAIGQTKAVRDVVLNAIPQWLIARAMDQCKGGVREGIEKRIAEAAKKTDGDIDKARAIVAAGCLAKLDKLGADEARVLAAFGRKSVASLTVEDLVIAVGSIRTLETGGDTVDAVFPMPEAQQTAAAVGQVESKLSDARNSAGRSGTAPNQDQPEGPITEDPFEGRA